MMNSILEKWALVTLLIKTGVQELTFQSEIESDDHGVSYSGCQVLINSLWGTNVRGQGVITRGGLVRGIETTRGLSTGGRTKHGCLERS